MHTEAPGLVRSSADDRAIAQPSNDHGLAGVPLMKLEHRGCAALGVQGEEQIAGELSVSTNTVNTHFRSIYAKLQVGDRASAVQRARQLRLLATGRPR